jgi:hypothetical protein
MTTPPPGPSKSALAFDDLLNTVRDEHSSLSQSGASGDQPPASASQPPPAAVDGENDE